MLKLSSDVNRLRESQYYSNFLCIMASCVVFK